MKYHITIRKKIIRPDEAFQIRCDTDDNIYFINLLSGLIMFIFNKNLF